MIFKFMDTTQEAAFAESIVAEYDRLRRSAALRDERPEKARQKLAKLAQQVATYCSTHKLNFYKKAKLMKMLQDQLGGKGATAEEVNAFVNESMTGSLRR
jgi:hypothetical protein